MPRYKVAVIGCAGRGRMHIDAYEHIDDAEVVACCAPSPTRRDPLAADYRLRAYGDVGEMLAAEQPDLVHITTGPGPRGQLMKQVAEHEIPLCTVEKPLAVGVRDWRSMEELEAVGGTRFAVCHQLRWQTNLARCREALESGRLGAVRFLEFSAGMNLPAQGTHTLHYGGSLNGDAAVVSVFGAASGLTEGDPLHPGPEHTVAQLVFENGVRALWQAGPSAPAVGDPATDNQHVRLVAYAERGRVSWSEFGPWEIVGPDGAQSGDHGGRDAWRRDNLLAQVGFHRAMFRWLETGEAPGTDLKRSLHEWKVALALYASALWRRPVDLAGFDPPDTLFEDLTTALRA